ncbi:MAG TPA: glycosyltransferase family 39 protein [Oceanobacillus sp.]|nr:glycosyltransferase family 39 protein [Oceanobacillus sp.]
MRFLVAYKLPIVLLLAIVARVSVFALFPDTFTFDQTGTIHGSAAYDTYAVNLLATGIYGKTAPGVADAHLPPLYSYLLAGLYGVFGRSSLAVVLLHIALDCASIALLYHLSKRLFPHGEWVGMWAGVFYALYPYLIFQNLTLIDTPLFMTLFYAFLLLALMLRQRTSLDRGTWGLAVLAGVVLGLTALTRPNALIIAPLVGLWFLFRRSLWQSVLRLLPVAVVSVLVLIPWTIRNFSVYGVFVPVALNGGENFYQGNNQYTIPYFSAGYDVQWVPPPDLPENASDLGVERNAALMQAGLDYLRENPGVIPDLLWTKFLVHWSIDIMPLRNPTAGELPRINYRGDTIAETDEEGDLAISGLPPGDPVDEYSGGTFELGRIIHRYYYGALFLIALVGLVLSLPHWREVSLLWMVQIGMTVAYMIFHPSTRYRVPTDPLLFAFSAYVLVWLWLRLRRGASPSVVQQIPERAA